MFEFLTLNGFIIHVTFLLIRKGKKKMDASDSDDTDEDDSDDELGEQIEKSDVINVEKSPESHKANESSGSVTGGKLDGESSVGCSSESPSSEQEKDTIEDGKIQSSENSPDGDFIEKEGRVKEPSVENHEQIMVQKKDSEELTEAKSCDVEKIVVGQSPVVTTLAENEVSHVEANGDHNSAPEKHDETVKAVSNVPVVEEPLDFNEYGSAAEMEVHLYFYVLVYFIMWSISVVFLILISLSIFLPCILWLYGSKTFYRIIIIEHLAQFGKKLSSPHSVKFSNQPDCDNHTYFVRAITFYNFVMAL